jgi:signal transduction histidine kinase
MSVSIRWRLAAGIILAFAVTLTVIFITVLIALQSILTGNLDEGLADDVRAVQAEMLLVGGLGNTAALEQRIQFYASTTEGRTPFITVIRRAGGEPVAVTAGVQERMMALSDEERARVLTGTPLTKTATLPGDREYRIRTQRVNLPNGDVALVQVARTTAPVVDPANTLLVILVAEGIVATLLAVGAALWLSRGAVKPLERVADVAREIQASDLRRRIGARKQASEVQKLADTFDAMLDRLEKAFNEQQQFLMDVSHELRTPLTVLKGNLEVMLMQPDLDNEARDQLAPMSAEVSRLIRLTTNLLYMASADAGREPERRDVDLDVVCLEILRQSRDLRNDVRLAMGHEDQMSVVGDRDQIKQMVLNLVENAMKFTPSGGEVTLSLYRNHSHAEIQVKDTGPGIPADILPNIFKRFYRGEHRSMMGGTGLGLAIADRIARSHGGSISVDSEVGKGTTFSVHLPLDGARDPPGGQTPARI